MTIKVAGCGTQEMCPILIKPLKPLYLLLSIGSDNYIRELAKNLKIHFVCLLNNGKHCLEIRFNYFSWGCMFMHP